MLVKTSGEPVALLPTVRNELRAFDPDLALVSAAPLGDQTRLSLLPVQLAAAVAIVLGLVVLSLAVIGTYGVTAYDLRRRTKELGIRIALGAEPARILLALVRDRLWWTVGAVLCGLACAALASSVLAGVLYGVSGLDPIAFAGVTILMCGTAAVATWWPARRAAKIDPMVVLRCE
jgi:ABC-type antimicrobial peptide transport system permease subunit